MSNICFKAFTAPRESLYRWCNIIGMILISSFYLSFISLKEFDTPEVFLGSLSLPGFLIGAFLVGLGTKLGNGCTSGHGVCGLPRLSIRSYVAVITFCTSGILLATFRDNYNFLQKGDLVDVAQNLHTSLTFYIVFGISCFASLVVIIYQIVKGYTDLLKDVFISLSVGIIFGLGLILSGMVKRSKILGFLTINKDWDPTLMFVLFSAVGFNFITFTLIIKNVEKPLVVGDKLDIPSNKVIDFQLVIGAALFGMGWGLSGLCPGPAMVSFFAYLPHLALFMVVLVLGQLTSDFITSKMAEKKNTENINLVINEEKKQDV